MTAKSPSAWRRASGESRARTPAARALPGTLGPASPVIAKRQAWLLALCVLCAGLALAGGWATSPAWALAWAWWALAGWWMGMLATQVWLSQRSNHAAWRAACQGNGADAGDAAHANARAGALPPVGHARALAVWLWCCWAAPQVFFWRQPFREWRWPDRLVAGAAPTPRAVLFVHGFVANRGFWNPWLQAMTARQEPFMAISLSQPFAPLDVQAAALTQAVDRILAETGQPPLIVAHSMGGVVVRAWLRLEAHQARDWRHRVHRVACLASPLDGTGLARWASQGLMTQLRREADGGTWLPALNAELDALGLPRSLFACWASNADNMVFPAHSALLPGAVHHVRHGVPHVPLAFRASVMHEVLALR